MGLVSRLADKHRDASRVAYLACDFVVLAFGGEEPAERQFVQPGWDLRIARADAEQAVSGANRIRAVEANPGLEFFDERRGGQLGSVALNHVVKHAPYGWTLGQQRHAHAVRCACAFEHRQFVVGQRLAVVVAPRDVARPSPRTAGMRTRTWVPAPPGGRPAWLRSVSRHSASGPAQRAPDFRRRSRGSRNVDAASSTAGAAATNVLLRMTPAANAERGTSFMVIGMRSVTKGLRCSASAQLAKASHLLSPARATKPDAQLPANRRSRGRVRAKGWSDDLA